MKKLHCKQEASNRKQKSHHPKNLYHSTENRYLEDALDIFYFFFCFRGGEREEESEARGGDSYLEIEGGIFFFFGAEMSTKITLHHVIFQNELHLM